MNSLMMLHKPMFFLKYQEVFQTADSESINHQNFRMFNRVFEFFAVNIFAACLHFQFTELVEVGKKFENITNIEI